jgi:hypothetical protein
LYRENISAELGELAHFAAWGQHTIRASSIGWLSMPRFYRQQTDDVALLIPKYIRKPDAAVKSHGKRIIG